MARTIYRLIKAGCAFGCFGLFGIIFIVVGFQSRARFTDQQKRFRAPTQLTMSQLAAKPPTEGWLQIKQGAIAALDTIYIEHTSKYDKAGTIRKMLIPVFPTADPSEKAKAPLVIISDDENVRSLLTDAKQNGWMASAGDDEKDLTPQQSKKLEAWITKNL